MSLLGWVMMIISYTVVTTLLVYCFYRVFTAPEASDSMTDDPADPFQIDTHDHDSPGSGTHD